jgi:hypothetical protein
MAATMVVPAYVVTATNQPNAFTAQNQNSRFRKGELKFCRKTTYDNVYGLERIGTEHCGRMVSIPDSCSGDPRFESQLADWLS